MTVTDATSRAASVGSAITGAVVAITGGIGVAGGVRSAFATDVVTAVVLFATGKSIAEAMTGAVAIEVDVVEDERAATITTPATTAITPRTIARSPYKARDEDPVVRTELDRFDRDGFALFTGPEIFFSESLWSLRSADSRYLIDRADFFAAFSRTAASSVNLTGSRVIAANRVPD